jgi:lysophospholipase L1-like esterase
MSAFVLDYDYNAPTAEHLQNTHESFFRIVRDANPELPIVMLSRPSYLQTEVVRERLEIIRTTYQNAVARGDRNVYLIDGRALMELAGNEGTVDGAHPTDLGFASMANALAPVLERAVRKLKNEI